MATVLACLDGSVYAESVLGHARWAARRLEAGVELMQVLGRREATTDDRSGAMSVGARRKLLDRLAELDAERAKLLLAEARMRLDEAAEQLGADGVAPVAQTIRHGDLLETISERVSEIDAPLIVVGKRGEAADFAKLHLGSNLERILRGATRPVLVAARAWKPIERFVIAYDGRASAERVVDAALSSPLFKGLEGVLVFAGDPNSAGATACRAAAERLKTAGAAIDARITPGPASEIVPKTVAETGADLLAMGAYGHTAIRSMLLGSTTSTVIRDARVPVLVYRG